MLEERWKINVEGETASSLSGYHSSTSDGVKIYSTHSSYRKYERIWKPKENERLVGTGKYWISTSTLANDAFDDLFGLLDDETTKALEEAISELKRDMEKNLEERTREMLNDSS